MPNPRKGEKKDDYISRCIGVLINEGKEQDQAVAICNSMWDESKKMSYEDMKVELDNSVWSKKFWEY